MSGFSFDANILIDALFNEQRAHSELLRAVNNGGIWVSRMAWIEVLSKGSPAAVAIAIRFMSGFGIDEIDTEIAERAADLRRQRPRLKLPNAVIQATAQLRGRILVTRDTRDFPANMPGIRVPYTL